MPRSAIAVRMYTTNTSASGPFVIHIFEPFATQPPSARSARQRHRPDHVGAGVGLAHRERADVLAREQRRQPSRALLGRCRWPRGCARTGSSAPRTTCRPTPTRARPPPPRRGARGSRAPRRRRPRARSDRARRGRRGAARAAGGTRRRDRSQSASGRELPLGERADGRRGAPRSRCGRPWTYTLRRRAPTRAGSKVAPMSGLCEWPRRSERVVRGAADHAHRPRVARLRRRTTAAMRALVDDLAGAARRARGGGGEAATERHRGRGQAHGAGTRSSGSSIAGAAFLELSPLAACDLYDGDAPGAGIVTGIGPVHGDPLRDRRQRRDREGRHLLPDHGEEAPARAGDRARRTACRASTSSTRAARSCRCRPRSSPTGTTSAASSTTRRACRPRASRRSRR